MRWNVASNSRQQALIAEALGMADTSAGDAIERLIGDLGLPLRLRDVGVKRNDFALIAAKTMRDPLIKTNAPIGRQRK